MTLTSLLRGTAQIFAVAVALGAGCADKVRTAISPCPCASGYVCCESGVCASDSESCGAATAALSLAAQGHWTGYVENATFSSGSDLLDMSFYVDGNGALHGTVFVGNTMPPAAPTDPDVGWPTPAQGPYVEGFPYEAHDIRWEAARLKFEIAPNEAWADWCALQTSYAYPNIGGSPSPIYLCVPSNGYGETDDGAGHCTIAVAPQSSDVPQPVDCAKFRLCDISGGGGYICKCDANGCVGNSYLDTSFDIALRDGVGDGSIVGGGLWMNGGIVPVDSARPVRLIRAGSAPVLGKGGAGGATGGAGRGGAGGGGSSGRGGSPAGGGPGGGPVGGSSGGTDAGNGGDGFGQTRCGGNGGRTSGLGGTGDIAGGEAGSNGAAGFTGTCMGTECGEVIASGQPRPVGIAVDATSVYWATWPDISNGTLVKMPKGGGDPVVIASGLVLPEFVIDATSIYWANSGSGRATKAPLAGGTPVEIVSDPNAFRFAIDDKNVYYGIPQKRGTCATGALMKAPLTGGDPIVVAAGLDTPNFLAVDATNIYWASRPDDFSGSTLRKMPLDGGPSTVLGSAEGYISRIVVDAANVYWTTYHELRRVSINGGSSVLLDSDVYGLELVLDGTNLFWTGDSGAIETMPTDGGTKTILATYQNPNGLAVDAQYVYWSDTGHGTIKRVARR